MDKSFVYYIFSLAALIVGTHSIFTGQLVFGGENDQRLIKGKWVRVIGVLLLLSSILLFMRNTYGYALLAFCIFAPWLK